jgi:O-antigen/teichoic acid export membrane protein
VVISVISFTGRYKPIKPSVDEIDFKLSKGVMNLGLKFFFVQICAIIIFSTSSFFIAQFYGPKEVVAYNIVFKYFQIPMMIFSIVLSPVWSAVTDAHVKSDFFWLRKTIKQLNLLSLVFTVGVILMLLLSPLVFNLWLGNKVVIPRNLSIAMAFYTVMQIGVAPYSNFINGLGKIKLTMSLTFVGIVIYLFLIYFFSNIFTDSTGIVMAIIGTSLIGSIVQPLQTHKILNGTASGIWDK